MSNAPRLLANPTTMPPMARTTVRLLLALDFEQFQIANSKATPEAVAGVIAQLAGQALSRVDVKPKSLVALAGGRADVDTILVLKNVTVGAAPKVKSESTPLGDAVQSIDTEQGGPFAATERALRVVRDDEPAKV